MCLGVLEPFLGKEIVQWGALFGLIAIAASFLILGNYLKNSLRYDFKLPYAPAVGIATLAPVLFFLVGFREFIAVLSIVGVVLGAMEGMLIIFLYKKAKVAGERVPEYSLKILKVFPYALGIILGGGAVAELYFNYVG